MWLSKDTPNEFVNLGILKDLCHFYYFLIIASYYTTKDLVAFSLAELISKGELINGYN